MDGSKFTPSVLRVIGSIKETLAKSTIESGIIDPNQRTRMYFMLIESYSKFHVIHIIIKHLQLAQSLWCSEVELGKHFVTGTSSTSY
jgi:hypothetical protein